MESSWQQLKSRAFELHDAVWYGNLQKVKSLVEDCDASVLFAIYKRIFMSITHSAIYALMDGKGVPILVRQNILEELVKAGADINESDVSMRFGKSTPLLIAVHDKPDILPFLLANNTQLTDCDDKMSPGSALYIAAHYCRRVLNKLMDLYDKSNRCFPWNKVIILVIGCGNECEIMSILQREYHLTESTDHLLSYFHMAASHGFTKVMRLLVEQQPQVLQADWLVNNNIPNALQTEQHRDFVAWLKDIRSRPLKLQLICRQAILHQLRPRPDQKIDQLPLPKKMKDFLKLKEGLMTSP